VTWRLPTSALSLSAFLSVGFPATAQPSNTCPAAGQGFDRLAAGGAEVAYRLQPSALNVGQFFAAEVIACQPHPGVARIALDATMPAHGHGMNYRPKSTEVAPGHYRFTGLMLHMPGRWQIVIDLYDGTRLIQRLTRDLDLKP
jgi:hypothetical protein